MMAKAVDISASFVQRIWRTHGLQPYRVHQFKLSNDPKFIDKLRDVVGLYVDPPAHAILLSVDERARIQALDRTQPFRPTPHGESQHEAHIMSTEMIIEVRRPCVSATPCQLGFISPDALFNNHWLPSDHVLPIIRPSKPRGNIFKDQGSPCV